MTVAVAMILAAGSGQEPVRSAPASRMGPLIVHPTNPRYFSDGTGRAIYLTGSHTHYNLLDGGRTDPPPPFDYAGYLEFLTSQGHNFIRLWTWELFRWTGSSGGSLIRAPMPWVRSGPGRATDGGPRFDLSRFNDAFFTRLRARVVDAHGRGIYVSVMLFEGWGLQFAQPPTGATGHPFHRLNNVNGIDGDLDGDGRIIEIHTMLAEPRLAAVRAVQEAYVRKVVETLRDLDNVLYEIANESGAYSTAWQYHMIEVIRAHERSLGVRHPVGMTIQYRGGRNEALFRSAADWISPDRRAPEPFDYRTDPPPNDGRKAVLLDTDHVGGVSVGWVWKSFLRGHHPTHMDLAPPLSTQPPAPDQELVRRAMGHTLAYARRVNLAAMTPRIDLASTRYALANPGREYLVFAPGRGEISVRLVRGRYRSEWFHAGSGRVTHRGEVAAAGGDQVFTVPFDGPAVLYLVRAER
jgi:hypothetical protein